MHGRSVPRFDWSQSGLEKDPDCDLRMAARIGQRYINCALNALILKDQAVGALAPG
jgi:hypothetical protein